MKFRDTLPGYIATNREVQTAYLGYERNKYCMYSNNILEQQYKCYKKKITWRFNVPNITQEEATALLTRVADAHNLLNVLALKYQCQMCCQKYARQFSIILHRNFVASFDQC